MTKKITFFSGQYRIFLMTGFNVSVNSTHSLQNTLLVYYQSTQDPSLAL